MFGREEPAELLEARYPGVVQRVDAGTARLSLDGHDLVVRYFDRGQGSTRVPFTEVIVVGLTRPDLFLNVLSRKSSDAASDAELRQGWGTDVEVGERRFDHAFVLEAAPAEVLPLLFDSTVRARMLALDPVGVRTHDGDKDVGAGLMVDRADWDGDAVVELVELARLLARQLPAAFEEAEQLRQARGGYRGERSNPASSRAQEIAEVHRRREERGAARTRAGCIGVVAILVVAVVIAVVVSALSNS